MDCSEDDYPLLRHTQLSFIDIKRYLSSLCCGNLWVVKREKTQTYLLTLIKCEPNFTFFGQLISHVHATTLGPGTVHTIDCGGCRVVEDGTSRTRCLTPVTKNLEMPGKYKDFILLGNFWHKISSMDQDMRLQSSKILGSISYILSLNVVFPFSHHSCYNC